MSASSAKPAIQAVVFDAYGTLFDIGAVSTVCAEAFPDRGEALARLWRTKQLEYTRLRSLMVQYEDFWRVTESALISACAALDLPCEEAVRSRLMEAHLRLPLYPGVHQALQALSHYRLAILSNGSPRMLEAVVAHAGLTEMFASLISADEVKIYKPSPRVYRLAVERLHVETSMIAFVSSNSWDIVGAKAYGFWSCWVNRCETPGEQLGFAPDRTIASLRELPGALGL